MAASKKNDVDITLTSVNTDPVYTTMAGDSSVLSFSSASIDSATPADWDRVSYAINQDYYKSDDLYGKLDINITTGASDFADANYGDIVINFGDEGEQTPEYKFKEGELIAEFKRYVDSTYSGHYSKNKFQSTEVIIERGHGTGFCMGNIDKYSNRYGNKGSRADARKDLMKVLHYALIQLYIHDMETEKLGE